MDLWKNSISLEKIERVVNSREKRQIRTMDYFSDAWNLVQQDLGANILFSFILFIVIQVISFFGNPLYSGWFIAAYMKRKGQPIEIGTFFKSFDHFGSLLIQTLLMGLIFIVPFIVLIIPGFVILDVLGEDVGFFFFFMYFFILFVVFMIATMMFIFAPLLIVFSSIDAWSAMKSSFKLISNNFFGFLGFFMMMIVMMFLGLMTCGLLLLIIIPVMQTAIYFAYEDLFNIDQTDEIDNIIEHLV